MTKSLSTGSAPPAPGAPAALEATTMKADSAQAARYRDRIIPLQLLSFNILSINTATQRAQQVQKCAAHGYRSRQCVRILGRIGGRPHARAHAPGIYAVHADIPLALEFLRQHAAHRLQSGLRDGIGSPIRPLVGHDSAADENDGGIRGFA